MSQTYEQILEFVIDKYRGIFESLYSINDDVLDEHLMHYLFDYNFVVLMKDQEQVHIYLGESNRYNGISRYGRVEQGIARYPDQRYSAERKLFNDKNSVVVYSNTDKHSVQYHLWEALTEIASIYYIEHNNLRLSDVKAIIQGTPATSDTMKNYFHEMFMNNKSYFVVKDSGKVGEEITKIDLDIEYIAEKYQQSALYWHNEILEIIGVNFTPLEKKERLVTNEVDSNNELTMNASKRFLDRMKRYLKKANEIFGTNLEIVKNEIKQEDPEEEDPEEIENPDEDQEESEENNE